MWRTVVCLTFDFLTLIAYSKRINDKIIDDNAGMMNEVDRFHETVQFLNILFEFNLLCL